MGAVALFCAPSASAVDYTDQLLTAGQVKKATKYAGQLESLPITPPKNNWTAYYRDPAKPTSSKSFYVSVYKYVAPKPTSTKPAKPDPNAPKIECTTTETAGTKYTSVCWSKTWVSAYSSVKIGKMMVAGSISDGKYDASSQGKAVKTTAKQRAVLARQAKAMRDAQVKQLGW